MNLTLRPFTDDDLVLLAHWRQAIQAEQFISRCQPKAGAEHCRQYLILADDKAVGTVWLEKAHDDPNIATLGILLGNPDCISRGIGRKAIEMSIQESSHSLRFTAVELNVRTNNHRAIACYRHCGFQVVGEGLKTHPDNQSIPYLIMRREIV